MKSVFLIFASFAFGQAALASPLEYPMSGASECSSSTAVVTYASCPIEQTVQVYTTGPQQTDWVGGGRNQDWGCEQIAGRFLSQIQEATDDTTRVIFVNKDEDKGRRDAGTRVVYQYFCEVRVVRDVMETLPDASCGENPYVTMIEATTPSTPLAELEAEIPGFASAYCTDCSNMLETGRFGDVANCV